MRFWQNVMRVICTILVVLGTLPLAGCIILQDGPGGSSGEPPSGVPSVACPRAPDLGATTPRTLPGAKLARANEVCQWVSDLYKQQGWNVLYTVQMPSGDLYDYVDVSGMPVVDLVPPPGMSDGTLPLGFDFVLSELDQHPELRGPTETQLRVRPSFPEYVNGGTGATSVDDFLRRIKVPGTPTGALRNYSGIFMRVNNLGASTFVAPYALTIKPGALSVMEMAVGCSNEAEPGAPLWQMVGVAASTDYADPSFANFNDSVLRLQVEFLTAGDRKDQLGEGLGGWAGGISQNDFKPYPNKNNPLAPGMALYPSAVDTVPVLSLFWIRIWNGNVWIGVNGIWIGYYLADTFFHTFDMGACKALWYSEAYRPSYDPDPALKQVAPDWPPTGSGHLAGEGLGKAAFFADPTYLDESSIPQPGVTDSQFDNVNGCYTTTIINGLAPFAWAVFVGGPGGAFDACPPPVPKNP